MTDPLIVTGLSVSYCVKKVGAPREEGRKKDKETQQQGGLGFPNRSKSTCPERTGKIHCGS